MKVVILAGGLGTRISEESHLKPKPMIGIGEKPILWHIMNIYASFGFNEFIICCGYKGYIIKEYFANYFLHNSDVTINTRDNTLEIHDKRSEDWKITLVDTGENTMTGGRVKRISKYITDTFFLTYGDGVANVDIKALLHFHKTKGVKATLTAVQPEGRFGGLSINNGFVTQFVEKPKGDRSWINGGFFVLEPDVFDLIEGDKTIWEKEPLESLAVESQLAVYQHSGFWKCMDTLRDKNELENLWASGSAPWRIK